MENFGKKVRVLREERGLTREAFCGDESELSVRHLARIESQHSIPNLARAKFIARQLNVTLGSLIGDENLELPKRYKELKYLLLRTQTYRDENRIALKEAYFDEIYSDFYDRVPESEQIAVECMRIKTDVFLTNNDALGKFLLDVHLKQVTQRNRYSVNDLIIIDLYMICLAASDYDFAKYDKDTYQLISSHLLSQEDNFLLEDIFILSNLLFNNISILSNLKMWDIADKTFAVLKNIMAKTQDFQKKPTLSMIEWKYTLTRHQDITKAYKFYEEAVMFARLIGDEYLVEKLEEEWEKSAT